MEVDEEQIREVYAHYGLAMYQAQILERQLAILLAAMFRNVKTVEEFDQALKENFEKTMGRLVNDLLRLGVPENVIKNLTKELRSALDTRNMLAHNYFWQRAVKFTSFDGRNAMLGELAQYLGLFTRLDNTLTELTMFWAKQHGVNQEDIDNVLNELLATDDNS